MMKRELGFTLIELLVVIAIIGILAAIVVPNVANYVARARMTRAVEEIRGCDLAMTAMLTDAKVRSFRDFFTSAGRTVFDDLDLADQVYVSTYVSYKLLRQGRSASNTWELPQTPLDPDVLARLGAAYNEEIGQDPWGKQYKFWFGPWRGAQIDGAVAGDILFRSWRLGNGNIDDLADYDPYEYDVVERNAAEQEVPGAPTEDGLSGYPAPTKLPVYIFSTGANQACDQLFALDSSTEGYGWSEAFADFPGYTFNGADVEDFWGGGDDVNNWDSEAGWTPFYS